MNRIWHLGMWALVNGLFLYKYSGRISVWAPLIGAAAILALTFLGIKAMSAADRKGRQNLVGLLAAVGLVAVSITAFHVLPTSMIRVDRFEMIQLFWDNTFAGIPPYTPKVPYVSNVPSQFPLYFVFALPFHLIHEVGWIPLIAVLGMGHLLWKMTSGQPAARGAALCLLLLSPALWWEIVCRSTIFANAVLFLVLLLPFYRSPTPPNGIRSSILLGIAAATRSISFQLMIPLFMQRFVRSPRAWWKSSILVFGTAALGIAPLLLPVFREWNPFKVSGLFLPSWIIAIVLFSTTIVACLRDGWKWSLSVAILGMDAMVFIYAGQIVWSEGWVNSIAGSAIDISYLLLSSPFHLYLLFQSMDTRGSESEPAKG
ncbi:MAG: hypothetical protein RL173_81 [Fibrobacterota bacterium]